MQSVDFGARLRPERQVMQRSRLPAIDRVAAESRQWRRDRKAQSGMFVCHDVLLMLFDDRAGSARETEPQERKQVVVKRHRNAHLSHGYFNVVDDRLHRLLPPGSRLPSQARKYRTSFRRKQALHALLAAL